MRTLLFSIMIFAGCAAIAQTEISSYQPGVTPEGATFCLPKTAVNITIQYVKTTYTPGDFCKYADRYLNIKNVETESRQRYSVNSIALSTKGVPDKSKYYSLVFNPKTSASNVRLSPEGILLAINTEPSKTVAPTPFVSAPKRPALNPQKYMTEEIMAAGSMAKMAELTAQEILDIRDSRNQLNRGEADYMPKDGEQLRIMIDNLNTQETALLQLFNGQTENDTLEKTITIVPDGVTPKKILFRFSRALGLVDDDDLSGVPYYISIEDLKTVDTVASIKEEITVDKNSSKMNIDDLFKKKKAENGVYVNVPGKISLKIYTSDKVWANQEFFAAQYGNTELLSEKLFNKKYTTSLTLDPATGALLKLNAEQPK
jgi:hypothetical protein